MAYISKGPLRPHERARIPSIEESARSVRAHEARKLAKKNWQPPKDPSDFYRRNGLASDAAVSAQTAAKRYDPHGND